MAAAIQAIDTPWELLKTAFVEGLGGCVRTNLWMI
jgi:hypothetical protein